jgi:BRCA1-associated protein
VIDCGASRIPAQVNKRIEIISERRWRERTKSFPPPPSTAAIRPQTAVRDWRFGRVTVESIDLVQDNREAYRQDTSSKRMAAGEEQGQAAGSSNPNAAAFAALELGPTLGGDGSTTRAECLTLPSKNTEVGWGVVHFYRGEEMPDLDLPSSSEEGGRIEDECTTLCIPAVPSYILPADFLGFVGEKWRKDVTHFRMVMTSRMSRYLVLIKFRDGTKAKEWQKEFNGKVFNSMVVCF